MILQELMDSVTIIEVLEPDDLKSCSTRGPEYKLRLNYSQFYKVLFESSFSDCKEEKSIVSETNKQDKVISEIFRCMSRQITSTHEDVVQTVDILEYFVKILNEVHNKRIIQDASELLRDILKGSS